MISACVNYIGDSAFQGCSGLTSITIPESVTSIGSWAFSGCSGLTSITIPDSVTSIGNNAFHGCSNIESVTIPKTIKRIETHAFFLCDSLKTVVFENTEGWFCYFIEKDTDFSSAELSNPQIAAKYLTNDYTFRTWESSSVMMIPADRTTILLAAEMIHLSIFLPI